MVLIKCFNLVTEVCRRIYGGLILRLQGGVGEWKSR